MSAEEAVRRYVVEDRDGDLWTWSAEESLWICRTESGENTWSDLAEAFGPLNLFEVIDPTKGEAGLGTDGAPIYVVHHHDIENHARSFNQGYAEAVEQFEELLRESADDLAVEAPAGELMGYLQDAVKAMGSGDA